MMIFHRFIHRFIHILVDLIYPYSFHISPYPPVNLQKAIEHGLVEIVDFPIEQGDFP